MAQIPNNPDPSQTQPDVHRQDDAIPNVNPAECAVPSLPADGLSDVQSVGTSSLANRSGDLDKGERVPPFLKPMDVKRLARVPYDTVIGWLTTGHPRAGILPSIDLAETRKRHSYRIRREDWEAFLDRLQTVPQERQPSGEEGSGVSGIAEVLRGWSVAS